MSRAYRARVVTRHISVRFAILLCCLPAAIPAQAPPINLPRLLEAVEKRYNAARTVEVPFEQTWSAPGRPARTEMGTLFLRKPGRMRWQYTDPPGKLFISDGKDIFFYSPAVNRVQKSPLKATDDARVPLAFLLGRLDFSRDFREFRVIPQGKETRVIALPKSKNAPFQHVDFTFTPDHRIARLTVANLDESAIEYKFGVEKVNPQLAANLFTFQPPPGVEFVESLQ